MNLTDCSSIYAAGSPRRGILSVGETRLLLDTTLAARAELRKRMLREADGFRAHGVLLVHTPAAEVARNIVEEVLFESTHEWRRAGRLPNPSRASGKATFDEFRSAVPMYREVSCAKPYRPLAMVLPGG